MYNLHDTTLVKTRKVLQEIDQNTSISNIPSVSSDENGRNFYFAILKKDKKWKTKKEALQKEIGSLGKGQFNHNQESICSNKI